MVVKLTPIIAYEIFGARRDHPRARLLLLMLLALMLNLSLLLTPNTTGRLVARSSFTLSLLLQAFTFRLLAVAAVFHGKRVALMTGRVVNPLLRWTQVMRYGKVQGHRGGITLT